MTNSLDSLALMVTATRYSADEISKVLGGEQQGASPDAVRSWICGKARPSAETAHELQRWLIDLRATLNNNRRLGPLRDAQLGALIVALQNPTQRKLWLAKRAELRRQHAGVR